jgi:hypothetical protein
MQVSTTANKTSGMKNSKTAVVVVKIESCANWTSHVPGILILPSCHTSQNIIDGPYIRKESIHDDAINVRHLLKRKKIKNVKQITENIGNEKPLNLWEF